MSKIDYLKGLIAQGEGLDIEFKKSDTSLPSNIFETICAFLNRKGGHIFLGVADDGRVLGVKKDTIQTQLDTLAKNMNNRQLIDPTFYLASEHVTIDGKDIIYIYVPESSQPHNHKGVIYDRNQDGDFKLTNQQLIASLYVRKQVSYTENRVFPYLDMSDFELRQFDTVRNLVRLTRSDHPWIDMSNEEILESARMRLKDVQTGKEGYTLAAALLFGKENTLASVLPHYKTDALCRKVDVERYDDRDDIRCNLMGAYSRLLAFIRKHLPDRFYLEGHQRMSIRELIFREVIANLLVHREFSNASPATMTIYRTTVVTENWNRPFMMGRISLDNLKPHPKNPVIANFFKQLGWVEELGSGLHKMYKYCPLYTKGASPIMEEGDVFKLSIRYEDGVDEDTSLVCKEKMKTVFNVDRIDDLFEVLALIERLPSSKASELADLLNKSLSTTNRYIRLLRAKNLVVFQGAPKNGGYQITPHGLNIFGVNNIEDDIVNNKMT